jgi:ADP-ribose diphosphatase
MFSDSEYFKLETDGNGEDYIRSGDEVLVVPLTAEGDILFAVEPSAAFGELMLLLPGGSPEPDETHAETANRELQEEIGYQAARLEYLGELRPWSKYLAVRSYVYLGSELSASKLHGDEKHEIGIERVPLCDLEALIADRRLLDARVIAALYIVRAHVRHSASVPVKPIAGGESTGSLHPEDRA